MAITQSSILPQQYVSQLGQDYGQQLAGLTAIPLDTSQFAPQVAGQDPLQTQAAALAGAGVGAYQPYLTEAAALGTQAATTMGGVSPYISAAGALTGTGAGAAGTAGTIASYMSPYQQQVIDTTLSEFDRVAAARQQGISDQAVALGGYGGGREGVQLAEYQTQSDRNRALLQAGMQQQGYGIGQQARQQDLMNQLTLGGATAGLAQGQLGLGGYQQGLAQLAPQLAGGDISMLTGIGDIQQRQAQNVLTAGLEGKRMAAFEPYQRLGVYGQGVGQIGQLPGTIQTTQTPDQTALQTALGWTGVVGGIMGGFAPPASAFG